MEKRVEEITEKSFDNLVRANIKLVDEKNALKTEIDMLKQDINLTLNSIEATIKIIEETNENEWILDRLKGFEFILKGEHDE